MIAIYQHPLFPKGKRGEKPSRRKKTTVFAERKFQGEGKSHKRSISLGHESGEPKTLGKKRVPYGENQVDGEDWKAKSSILGF